jgi:hypothetical protein
MGVGSSPTILTLKSKSMKKIYNYFFPNYTKWESVCVKTRLKYSNMYDVYLIQARCRKHDNVIQFRRTWVDEFREDQIPDAKILMDITI